MLEKRVSELSSKLKATPHRPSSGQGTQGPRGSGGQGSCPAVGKLCRGLFTDTPTQGCS